MKLNVRISLFLLPIILLNACTNKNQKLVDKTFAFPEEIARQWAGPQFWANRLQDWKINNGSLSCLVSGKNRNINFLTYRIQEAGEDFLLSFEGKLENDSLLNNAKSWVGFRIGAKGQFNDYRDDAVYGKGIEAGLTSTGQLFIGDTKALVAKPIDELKNILTKGFLLYISNERKSGGNILSLQVLSRDKKLLAELKSESIDDQKLSGSIALVSHFETSGENKLKPSLTVDNIHISGDKIAHYPERAFGPVLFAQYTLHHNTVKLTAQLAPVSQQDEKKAVLLLKKDGKWLKESESAVDPLSRTAHFRLENWNTAEDIPYKISYTYRDEKEEKEGSFEGIIRHEPVEKDKIKLAAFACSNDLGFPAADLTEAILVHDPDILFFSGDQIYEGVGGYGVQYFPTDKAVLDYLNKWYIWGWSFREFFKDRPAITIPDDHDVFHGNVWGCGGKASNNEYGKDAQDFGGYKMPPEWIKMVERTQTTHLPDPYDPTPVKQGIGVYYTEVDFAGISFAVIEDRKFKSAPKALLPKADIDNGWPMNPDFDAKKESDVEGAILLGERQLSFLDHWSKDWTGDTWMKVLLSQTIFENLATLPAGENHDKIVPKLKVWPVGEYPPDDRAVSDFDSNGWPQTGRNKAIDIIRRCFALHIAGDQHLGSVTKYGVDEWRDAGFAFCVPAISNIWPRRWFPQEKGKNQSPGKPRYTGDYEDGFGNLTSVYAVANPHLSGKKPEHLYDRVPGYGIITFDKSSRDITMECWPRFINPKDADAKQYKDWPVVINQLDNYDREAIAYLPEIRVNGMQDPVIQVIQKDDKEIVYTLRIKGQSFKPKVYKKGSYIVKVGNPDATMKEVSAKASKEPNDAILEINF